MKLEQQSSYRQTLKATGLFGGVQVFNILIGIVRSKFIAVLLGPAGMGIAGLLTSTIGMIAGLTEFGLGSSAVKNVAEAHAQHDKQRISVVVSTLRRLVWITGLLGTFVTLVLAPWLSELTFGNWDYTYPFMFLSITLLFTQLSIGQNVLLQGTRSLKKLAKANVLGSSLGLFVTVPLYYYFGTDGIVPAISIASVVTLTLSWYFSRTIPIKSTQLSFKEIWHEGHGMLTMGFLLSLSGLLALAVSYLTKIYIGRVGGMDQVGLYNAGFAIIVTYTGLVLSAMGTDYYPRLSGVAHNNQLSKEVINQQAEIAVLLLAPLLMAFFVFGNWIVQLLYSSQFIPVNGMIHWAALGMFFRAVSWSIAFIFMAKGASKLFFVNELVANIYGLLFNVLGYKFFGLDGLGMAFLVSYIVYLVQVFVVCNRKYVFGFGSNFVRIFALQLACAGTCFCVVKFISSPYQYLVGIGLIVLSSVYSLRELNKKLAIKEIITARLKKNKRGK
ncbi:O-antigen translocase [Bacteroidia bacterium]|nr:O-antigen translocase [Bacteroidia bacterium]